MNPPEPSAPLEGVLVLDLSRVLAGPYCTMTLADLGARVIKVEHPVGGDITRGWGPPYSPEGDSAYYQSINRNKESIVLDLASGAGRRSVEILASRADVLIENFPPGGLARLGLSLERLRAENPRLVTASITGFGEAGPDRDQPGFDLLAQAGAGLMAITGDPGGPPVKVGIAVSDLVAGANAAIGILAALAARERSGRGAAVAVDLFSSSLAMLVNVLQSCIVSGREAGRHGSGHAQIVPYQMFGSADGEWILAIGTERQFRTLCERVVGRPEWASDPRFSTNAARVENRDALVGALAEIFAGRPRGEWIARCREAGVPAGPVRGPLEALESGQARAMGLRVKEGGFESVASPVRFAGRTPPVRRPPRLGEHTDAIRREFGLP
ncbi:MAG TPA: CoA transferase [Thermoanaerobaculia bacterium]|nr:CoA transferase [Thermoanaerobaculia bacterium]